MEKQTLLKKAGDVFKALFSVEEIKVLKDAEQKLNGELMPIPTMTEAKLKDGTVIHYEGELMEGTAIMVITPDSGHIAAPDATHELEDGTKVTTVGGLVTKIELPATPAAPVDNATIVAQMTAQFNAQFAAEKKSLLEEIKELKVIQLATLKAFDKAMNTPVDDEPVGKVKSYEDLSPAEKHRINNPI